ncbi:MAG: hypothetical protein IJT87_04360 [Ruminiclostridium sp.]|nr:hypothetical protein [Ruminiclostridium sp.]
MKITTFDPLIITKESESVIAVFEALGFERRHRNDKIPDREGIVGVRMENENGYHVDIVQSGNVQSDQMTVRINVDDFDEAYKMFEERGFKSNTDKPIVMPSSKSIGLTAPSGFRISLAQHIKDHD